jgi:hypothetical protein
VEVSHHAPAYLDEAYPVNVHITNLDARPLDVTMDVLLQPIDGEGGKALKTEHLLDKYTYC